jgi:SAM-dependent methyltransferase
MPAALWHHSRPDEGGLVTAPELMDRKQDISAEFNGIAKRYDWLGTYDFTFVRNIRRTAERMELGPAPRVLDLCCGTGQSMDAMLQAYPDADITGIDRSPGMLAIARSKPIAQKVESVEGDAGDPRGAGIEGEFDAVLSSWGVRNIPQESDPDPDRPFREATMRNGSRVGAVMRPSTSRSGCAGPRMYAWQGVKNAHRSADGLGRVGSSLRGARSAACTQPQHERSAWRHSHRSMCGRGRPPDAPFPTPCLVLSGPARYSSSAVADLELPPDYQDLLREFVEGGVSFVLVGGWAVAVHGHPRATDDMDLFVDASEENSVRVFDALDRFGAPLALHGVTAGLFAQDEYGYRVGRKPLLIEVLTAIDGVSFAEAEEAAVHVQVADFVVPVIGRDALLRNKRAAGRAKDLADLEALDPGE